jgi:hypothetical protein
MPNPSDRLSKLESDMNSAFESTKNLVESGTAELSKLWQERMTGVRASFESGTARVVDEMNERASAVQTEALARHERLIEELARGMSETALKWQRRVVSLWSVTSGWLLIWLIVLLALNVWTWWTGRRAHETWTSLALAQETYRTESEAYKLMRDRGVKIIETTEGLWIQTDSGVRTKVMKDGTRWLLLKR